MKLRGLEISRSHAELYATSASGWALRDLGSRNGTQVNGRSIAVDTVVNPGDLIRVGEWIGVIVSTPQAVEEAVVDEQPTGALFGAAMQSLLVRAQRAASKGLPLVIQGETGTGKELVAKWVHRWGGRSGKFVLVDCAALPEGSAEARLFGALGAASGEGEIGLIREAHGGTLVLDEVSDLPLWVQDKLVQVLATGRVVPVDGSQAFPIDLSLVATSQDSLAAPATAGVLRRELLSRLRGLELRLPPLRARREEILPLFIHEMAQVMRGVRPELTPDLAEQLCLYDWPFNVREVLQLAHQLAVFFGNESRIDLAVLPERIRRGAGRMHRRTSKPPRSSSYDRRLKSRSARCHDQLEQLVAGLRVSSGNVSAAAHELGISREAAYRLMKLRPELELWDLHDSEQV